MPASESTDGREKAANESADPGSRLRQAREAQGLSLEDLGNELRVGAAALGALEENRFEALGPPVFAKGYLKQYGAKLGLDVRELAALYERAAADQSQIELAPTKGIRLRDERRIGFWVVATLALVLAVGGLSYWWLRQSESAMDRAAGGDDDSGSAAAAPAPVQAAGVAAEAETAPERQPERGPESELAAQGLVPAIDAPPRAEPPPMPASAQAALASATESPPVPDGPALEVIFIEDSWAEIIDEDGNRLFYDLGRAGTRALIPADRNLNLYFGNASGVELKIDGEDVAIPGAGRRDVVRFDLDAVTD